MKVQYNKQVINKSAYVVLGVNLRGEKEVLGLWLAAGLRSGDSSGATNQSRGFLRQLNLPCQASF